MRVFLDTNVVVSAVATRGLCADLFAAILAEHELVLGETVLDEIRRVLGRKLRVQRATLEELDGLLSSHATVARAPAKSAIKGLDAADAAVVAEAVAGRAEVLVSGDQDLLKLADPPIPIVSPRGLWDLLRRAT
ncbi:MAG TPA: putative toxin-antitoxin system toxin component, PIN family [Gemmatimonadales bacterium]|nr:putative toxin-antitoxin system toxin component, PIN family [Gemmatimonadales bacterium]